jgi:hypothetical protein
MLAGRPAFVVEGDSPYAVIYKIVHKEPAPLGGVPQPVASAIKRAMSKDPHDRFPDMESFARALEGVLGGVAVASTLPATPRGGTLAEERAVAIPPTLPAPSRRPRALYALIALLVVGGGAGTAIYLARKPAAEAPKAPPAEPPAPPPAAPPPVVAAPKPPEPVAPPPAAAPPSEPAPAPVEPKRPKPKSSASKHPPKAKPAAAPPAPAPAAPAPIKKKPPPELEPPPE